MKFLFYLLLSSFACLAQKGSSATELDSLLNAAKGQKNEKTQLELYVRIAKSYQNIDPVQGLAYGNKALALAKKLKDADKTTTAEMSLGVNHYHLGDLEKAKSFFTAALHHTNNEELQIECNLLLGKYYLAKANYSQTLTYNLKALKASENISYEKGIASAAYTIGMTYNFLMKPNEGIKYFNKALAISKKLNNKRGICANLHGLGTQYESLGKLKEALRYYMIAKKYSDEMNDDVSTANIYSSLGNVLFSLGKIEDALSYIIKAREAAERVGNARVIGTAKFLEGRIYLNLYKQGKAYKNVDLLNASEKLMLESIEVEKASGNKVTIAQAYEQLSQIYSFRKDYKKAKDAYFTVILYNDSIYNEDTKQTIKSLEDQRTIDIKNKEIQLNKLKLSNQEKEKWIFISGILFLLIIGGLLFYQSRNRKKTNQKLQLLNEELDSANKTKARFFSILNHDLRSPVSNLIHFLHLQKENPELLDEESKKRMENKTILGAENLLNSMEDILLWSKGQMENFTPKTKKVAIRSVFEDTKNHFLSEEKIQITYINEGDIQLTTDENYLKTIIRNLTGNAIKALEKTENPTITWKAWQDKNQIYLSVSDNGLGGSQEQFRALYDEKEVIGIKTGLGLHLIRDLAKAIDCKITVDSKINEGTTFTLHF